MADILSYKGDAELGLGASPGIPVSVPDNLKVINETARDIMLLGNERNLKLFQQKVNDRDNLTAQILADKVAVGTIEPEYQKFYDEASKNVSDKFMKWKGNWNDIKGYRDYEGAVQNLKDVAAHAQTNTASLMKLRQQEAAETLPWKKAEIAKHIEEQKAKGMGGLIDPYQEFHDLSMDDVNKAKTLRTTNVPDKEKPWLSYDETNFDYLGTRNKLRDDFLDQGKPADSIVKLLEKIQDYNADQQKKTFGAIDSQIDKYNQENGLQTGDPGYVEHLKLQPFQGKTKIAEPAVDFAAKWILSQQEKFKTRTSKYDYKLLAAKQKQDELGLKREKLAIDWKKANVIVDKWKTQKANLTQDEDEANQKYDDLVNKIDDSGQSGRINVDQIPTSRQFIGGITYDIKGKSRIGRVWPKFNLYSPTEGKIVDKELSFKAYESDFKAKKTDLEYPDWVKQNAKEKGYKVESYYDSKFFDSKGKEITSPQDLTPDLIKGYQSAQKKYGMTFNQYLKGLTKLGKIIAQFEGDNGLGTPQTILEGTREENSKLGKKGKPVYGGDESGIEIDNTSNEQTPEDN